MDVLDNYFEKEEYPIIREEINSDIFNGQPIVLEEITLSSTLILIPESFLQNSE